MKRIMIAGLAVLAGTALSVKAAPVYSVNMVGYQQLNVASNLNMFALNWNLVGGVDSVAIQDLFDNTALHGGYGYGSADDILVWDPSLAGGAGDYVRYYFYDTGGADPTYDKTWWKAGDDSAPTTNRLDRGQGFWFKRRAAATTVAVAGEVPTDATNQVVFGLGLSQFGSAYTAGLKLNGSNTTWAINGGYGYGSADDILVWDPSLASGAGDYVRYYFYDTGGADPTYDKTWWKAGDDSAPTQDEIPIGAGAWYKNRGPGASSTFTEIKPY